MKKKIIDKNYGSIPHLSISKLNQQADKKINAGQEKILTKTARDWKDLIIVTEKLDGSNVGVINKNGQIKALVRSGYEAASSGFKQHIYFDEWVRWNIDKFLWLPESWRIVGEWMIQAHGTMYDITGEARFKAFDVINAYNRRIPYLDFLKICIGHNISIVNLIHIGHPISIKNALKILGSGIYGKPEKPEGVVYRCERNGKVDFMAKYVRHDKEDGKYLNREMWNKGFGYGVNTN